MTDQEIISDLTQSLGNYFERYMKEQNIEVKISFLEPVPDIKTNLNIPILNIYCMDVLVKKDPKPGNVPDKLYFKIVVSYLICFYANNPIKEQKLLGTAIFGLLNTDVLPKEDLSGHISKDKDKEKVKIKFAKEIRFPQKIMLFDTLKSPYHLSQGIQLETRYCCTVAPKKKPQSRSSDLGFV